MVLVMYSLVTDRGDETIADKKDGKALAKQYCQSCHMEPSPLLLPKERWSTTILPVMGLFLGTTPISIPTNEIEKSLFPTNPIMNTEEWQLLNNYYLQNAPERLPDQKLRAPVTMALPMFDVVIPSEDMFSTTSITSLCKIDTISHPRRIIVGNGMTRELLFFDASLKLKKKLQTYGPVVDIAIRRDTMLMCQIGKDVTANDLNNGTILFLLQHRKQMENRILLDSLSRPVQILSSDFNGDRREDFLIAQFGNLKGNLSWMENISQNKYTAHLIKSMPGTLHSIIKDVNHDGLPDVWTLFAQGDECIILFTNKGNGAFEEKRILNFPPTYGSSSFELIDIDKDGDDDIVYTCGDNGDYSRILKPYHGLYIYLNNGADIFSETFFYPINGCYKSITRDFDQDGDLDIATISYFPSSATPWESFVLLKNEGDFNFRPYTLPQDALFQKGVTMDAGDLDGDGKIDLLLGSGYYNSDVTRGHKEPLFILLKGK